MIDHASRLTALTASVGEAGIERLLVTDLTNVRYLTGFSGTNGQLLVGSGESVFFTDPRYEARARALVRTAEVVIYRNKIVERLPEVLGASSLGIEADGMTVAQRQELEQGLGREVTATRGLVEALRRRKDRNEEALIREAVRLADEAFGAILGYLGPGRTEREVAFELELLMRRAGAEAVSFDPIVGSGPLSAHIHHAPSDRELAPGDLVLLDFGARWEGYCSDLTRTVVLGPATDRQKELYAIVKDANAAGIAAVAPGVSGVDADAAARVVITTGGHGETFGHGTGHGVGLDIHESPRLHVTSEDTLQEREVVTVEPGIYLQGWGGIRIEDCVLVTAEGSEVLSKAPKDELIEVGMPA